jgi:hypothetical protein
VNAVNPRARAKARIQPRLEAAAIHPRVEAAAASMLSMDLLVAGFAIVGAVLLSFLR